MMILITCGLLLAQSAPLEPTQRFTVEGYAWDVAFLPGGRRIFLVEEREKGGSAASIMEIATRHTLLRIDRSEKGPVEHFTLSRDGGTIAGIASGVFLTAWDSQSGRKLMEIWPSGTITRAALSPDGKIIAHSNPRGGPIPLYRVETGKEFRKLGQELMDGCDSPLGFSPDGRYLVESPRREGAMIWEMASGRTVGSVPGATGSGQPIFSPDGELLALIGKDDSGVRIFRLADRSEIHLLGEDDTDVQSLAFSPDSRLIAFQTPKKGFRIREKASGTDALRLASSGDRPVFSPDSSMLAAVTGREFHVWRLAQDGPLEIPDSEFDELWKRLAERDAAVAYPAIARLARGGKKTMDFLRRRLLERPMDVARLNSLLGALASDEVRERERATAEAADSAHDPALWSALENAPSEEVKARARMIVEGQRAFVLGLSSLLRRERAVWVLERMDAQDVLAEIARGDVRARQTIDAKAALLRLKPR